MFSKAAELIKKPDRLIVILALVVVAALAWIYVFNLDSGMSGIQMNASMGMDMDNMQMSMPAGDLLGSRDILLIILMWAVMMIAMMIPSAAPMILTFDGLNRQHYANQTRFFATAAFVFGYLMVWVSFSVGATFLQWGFHSTALLNPMTISVTPVISGILLILAGVYQFTPLKRACLSHCRSPLSFHLTEWRDGIQGALIMGLRYGMYCLGCCWLLMILLFVAGVMNLLWVAIIAIYVLVEKVMPQGQWISRAIGLLAIAAGVWIII